MRASRALLALTLCLLLSACTFSATGSVETDPDRIAVAVEFATFTPQATQTPTAVATATDTPLPPTATPEPSATATEQPTPTLTPEVACDYTILPTQAQFDGRHVLPGEVVCLPSGTRGKLDLFNLHGAAGLPIRVVPAGGVVTIQAEPDQITRVFGLYATTHLHLDGSEAGAECGTYLGTAGLPLPYVPQVCGLRVLGGGVGIRADRNVSDLEFSHIEVGDSNFTASFAAGLLVRDAGGGVFRNLRVHHTHVHDTKNECLYISYAVSQSISPFEDVWVTDNYFHDCGWEALDVKQSTRVEVARNALLASGVPNTVANGEGKSVGIIYSTEVWLHHNRIWHVPEECIKTLGPVSGIVVEHNEIGGCGRHHVLDYTGPDTVVRWNELWLPGRGVDVRGAESRVHDNVWR